jgi:hypothetical protein
MTLYSTVGGALMSFEPTCRTTAAGCVCGGAVGTNDRYLLQVECQIMQKFKKFHITIQILSNDGDAIIGGFACEFLPLFN